MRKLIMPDMRFGKIMVPGGWAAVVPTVRPDTSSVKQAMVAGATEASYLEATQDAYERGVAHSIRYFIRYWARQYAKAYPDRHDKSTGELEGFKPTDIIQFWVPGKAQHFGYANMKLRNQMHYTMRGH